jgi:hypothetical protein
LRRRLILVPLATAALALGACGDDDGDESAEEPSVTPQQALAEIPEVRQGLTQGLAAYRQGDAEQADTLIGNAYLEHFELVEGPLDEADHELNEELEELIATEIRDEIKAGAPVGEVAQLVSEAQTDLTRAAEELRAG